MINVLQEKVIQIDGSRVLTNRGRMFDRLIDMKGVYYWVEVEGPIFEFKPEEESGTSHGSSHFDTILEQSFDN